MCAFAALGLMIVAGGRAGALDCGKKGSIRATADRARVMRGESVGIAVEACYGAPGYRMMARVREAPDVVLPMSYDAKSKRWRLTYRATPEIYPAAYHVEFFVRDAKGKTVREYGKSGVVGVEVAWTEEQLNKLAEWRGSKERMIREQTEKFDSVFASQLPRFPLVGVWFDAGMYGKHRPTTTEAPGPWSPYLRRSMTDELNYLKDTLRMNMISFSGGTAAEAESARLRFPVFISDKPKRGDYAIYDEPDFSGAPMEDVIAWAKGMKAKGITPIVNFSGHKSDDAWLDYAYSFLEKYTPDVVSVKCYPVFYDVSAADFCKERIAKLGALAHEKGARFFVVVQAFSQLGEWSFPTLYQLREMLIASWTTRADGVLFFLWTSGADSRRFMVGLNAMPLDYHWLIRDVVKTTAAVPQEEPDTLSPPKDD